MMGSLSNGQSTVRAYDHIFLGRGGSRSGRKVHGGSGRIAFAALGGRSSRKVHGGVGMGDAALLSENRVRRGGKRFGFQPHDVGLAQFVALPAFLGGGRSRKVHGGSRRKVHGGSRRIAFAALGGRSRKVGGGQRLALV